MLKHSDLGIWGPNPIGSYVQHELLIWTGNQTVQAVTTSSKHDTEWKQAFNAWESWLMDLLTIDLELQRFLTIRMSLKHQTSGKKNRSQQHNKLHCIKHLRFISRKIRTTCHNSKHAMAVQINITQRRGSTWMNPHAMLLRQWDTHLYIYIKA